MVHISITFQAGYIGSSTSFGSVGSTASSVSSFGVDPFVRSSVAPTVIGVSGGLPPSTGERNIFACHHTLH